MRVSFEEPTGIFVRGVDGQEVPLTFSAFVAAIQGGAVEPDDQIWSRIVTDGRWVRAADMRLFQMLMTEQQAAHLGSTATEADPVTWPPPISPPP